MVIQIKSEIWSVWVSNLWPYLCQHHTLPTELSDHLIQMHSKFTIFIQWIYANYLKRESNPNKKWILVRMSLEHLTLPLLIPRFTNWANWPLDTNALQIYNFYSMNIRLLFKKRK